MPICMLLTGLPGSGKTSFRNGVLNLQDFEVISSDDLIEDLAEKRGLTYNEAFGNYIEATNTVSILNYRKAVLNKQNIIVDRTNLSKESREKFLKDLPEEYVKICVVCFRPFGEILETRSCEGADKYLSEDLLRSMADRFELPSTEEGFNLIFHNEGDY